MKCPRCGHEPMVEPSGGVNKYGCLKCSYVIRRDGTVIGGDDLNTLIAKAIKENEGK